MHSIIKNGAAFAGAMEAREQFDPQKVAGAFVNQSDLDKALATGNIARISPGALANRTDWNGLTPEQERQKDDERLSQKQMEEALAEAEYEQTMAEVREQADRLMTQLEEQKHETLQKLAEADARAIVLPDGRRVLVGDKPGEFIAEDTGKTLEGPDKAEAQSLQKPDSETAAEQKALRDRLIQIDDAEEHVRKAEALAGQDGKDLSPEEKKQNETEARKELAAAATANAQKRIEASADTVSALDNTDTLSALGLDAPANGRTASFAATLDGKDSRATGLQDQFTGAAQGPDAPPTPPTVTSPVNNPSPSGTISKPHISQPIQ